MFFDIIKIVVIVVFIHVISGYFQSTPTKSVSNELSASCQQLVVIIIICDEDDVGLFENINDWLYEMMLDYLKTSTIVFR